MNKFQGLKRITQLASFSLITTFVLLMHVNFASGEGLGVGPNQGFDTVTLLAEQDATFATTTTSAAATHSIAVISCFNRIIKAQLKPSSDGAGMWWMIMFGTGGEKFTRKHSPAPRDFDFAYGVIWPGMNYAKNANVWCDIDPLLSFALAIGGVYLTSPVSAEEPFKYSIKIDTTAHEFY